MSEASGNIITRKTGTTGWLAHVLVNLSNRVESVLVTVVAAKGSTPRNIGARMIVTKDDIWQTIGGGALEFDVMARARVMLGSNSTKWQRQLVKIVLGPDMGQCCGGSLSVLLERFGLDEAEALSAFDAGEESHLILAHPLSSGLPLVPHSLSDLPMEKVFLAPMHEKNIPLFIYGAGHVSRALLPRILGLGFDVFLVDISTARFPPKIDADVAKVLAKDPAAVARRAPAEAVHLVMTHDHALDEAICLQILLRGDFAFLGLIGSATKRARFVRRLKQAGISAAMLDLLVCPVGIAEITGKSPAQVALSISAQLVIWQQSGKNTGIRAGIDKAMAGQKSRENCHS